MSKMLGSDRGITVTAQNINEASTTQMHKLGERLVKDERVFRYAQCKTEALTAGRAAQTLINPEESYACGATTVHDVDANTVTIDTVANLTKDQLAGGYLCYKSTRFYSHKILSHPEATATYTCVVTLETPITDYTITTGSTTVVCFPSIWRVRGRITAAGGWYSWVGVPLCSVAANSYCWLQTWGPILMCPADFYGAAEFEKTMKFSDDGSIAAFAAAEPGYQHAGFLLPDVWTVSSAGTDLADPSHLINLTIFP